MSARRALFFPWSAGGGAGYTGRCLALAARLAEDSWECAFGPEALPRLVEEAGFPLAGPRERWNPAAPRHDYLAFAGLERVYAVAARYYRAGLVREHVRRDRATIEAQRPDLVVIDMQPTAAIAARALGLPVLSLADADFLSPSPLAWMPWLTLAPEALLPYPDSLPAFNEVLAEQGMEPLDSPSELLWGDVTLVPSCAELEPLPPPPPGRRPALHVGPLYWDPPVEIEQPPAPAGAARVYVTVGAGSMISRRLLGRVLEAVVEPGRVVFASVGAAPPPGLAVPENLHLGGFTGLSRPLRWCDVVISHGGYSTVVASHLHGRPQVILPLMSEHEANGRQMVERPGCGLLVRRTRSDERTRRLRFVNRVSGESEDPLPAAEDLRATLAAVLADAGARERAGEISRSLRRARAQADLGALLEPAIG